MSMTTDSAGDDGISAPGLGFTPEDMISALERQFAKEGMSVSAEDRAALLGDLTGNPIAPPPPVAPDLNDPSQVAQIIAANPVAAAIAEQDATFAPSTDASTAPASVAPAAAPPAPVPASGTVTESTPVDPNALPIDDPNRVRFVIPKAEDQVTASQVTASQAAAGVPAANPVSAPGAPILPDENVGGAPGAESQVYDPATARPDMTMLAEQRYGQQITVNDAANIFGVYDQVMSLPPSLQQAVAAVVNGDFAGAANIMNLAAQASGQVTAPTAPAPTPVAPPPAPEQYYDAWGNPIPNTPPQPTAPAAPVVDPATAARLAAMEQELNNQRFANARREQEMIEREVAAGVQTYARSVANVLTPQEIATVHAAVVSNYQDILHTQVARGNTTYRDAMTELMSVVANSNPSIAGKLSAARDAAIREREIQDQQRKQMAAAVSGGTNGAPQRSVSQPAPTPMGVPTPGTPQSGGRLMGDADMAAAIAHELRQTMASSIG